MARGCIAMVSTCITERSSLATHEVKPGERGTKASIRVRKSEMEIEARVALKR